MRPVGARNCVALFTANGVTNFQPVKAGVVEAGNSGAGVAWWMPGAAASAYGGELGVPEPSMGTSVMPLNA